MRILELAPFARIPGLVGFENYKSGLAIAIGNICLSLSVEDEVYLLTHSAFTKKMAIGNLQIVRKNWCDILFGIRYKSLKFGFRAIKGLNAPIKYKLRVLLYFATEGYVEKIIKIIKPDIVHIHTIGFYSIPYIMACINCNVPFVLSLHGVISYLDSNSIDEKQRKMERKTCELASSKDIPVTVVSSGVKKRFINDFNINKDVFSVVLNGFIPQELNVECGKDNIRKKLEIDEETFVFLCVSSITKNKNQVQIIRAYDLIKVERNIKAALVFVGDGPDSDSLITAINNSPNKKSIHYVGRIPHDDMQYYYSIANCIVNASKEEGFGLPIIEAMAFGVPTVIFDDLDAVEDLYNEHCMIKVSKRTDEELSNAMKNAIDKSWNKAQIIEISKSFTVYQMARNYKILFEAYKNRNINITLSDIENLL